MTLVAEPSFRPVARNAYLERLGALRPRPALALGLWANVHKEAQLQLDSLETDVRQIVPGIQVSSGRTRGDHFLLFTYRTFCVPGVVVGMTFTAVDQRVAVEADVSGEQTGDCISSVPSKTVANSRKELLAAARESARNLCRSARAIAAALTDPSRRVE